MRPIQLPVVVLHAHRGQKSQLLNKSRRSILFGTESRRVPLHSSHFWQTPCHSLGSHTSWRVSTLAIRGRQTKLRAFTNDHNQDSRQKKPTEDLKPFSDTESVFRFNSDGTITQVIRNSASSPATKFPLYFIYAFLKSLIQKIPGQARRNRLIFLKNRADSDPDNVEKELVYLQELGRQKPSEVIDRFESRKQPANEALVVEYMRALVNSGNISKYEQTKAADLNGETLGTLLGTLKNRCEGGMETAVPGQSGKAPLHVVLATPEGKGFGSFVKSLLGNLLMGFLIISTWFLCTGAIRKYVTGAQMRADVTTSVPNPNSRSSSSSFAPKEYKKEDMPETSLKTFADVKGCDEAKYELEEIVQYLKNPTKFTRLGAKLPKGVLLVGPPGTGKTLLARAVAGEADVPFFYRAGSEFEEMFVGVGSRRVRDLFAAAKKKTPCIVFIDEIDAIGGSRKDLESQSGGGRKTLNQLLVEMDGFEENNGIIVLAATNLAETLDPALTRPGRIDRQVHVSNPDIKGRTEILEYYLKDIPKDDDVVAEAVARRTPGFSGADLYNLVNHAAIQGAVMDADKIDMQMLDFARDRILMGSERKSMVLSQENRKLTAYHEGGHALVAINTDGALPVHKATIMPRGNALGMVSQLPEKDDTSMSMRQMLARLDVCMGGRVAEELIFGTDQVTSGASNDLKQATSLARHMVMQCGMSNAVGPCAIDRTASSATQRMVDDEVRKLLQEAYQRVEQLLSMHQEELHSLANALLEKETLNACEIKEVVAASAAASKARIAAQAQEESSKFESETSSQIQEPLPPIMPTVVEVEIAEDSVEEISRRG